MSRMTQHDAPATPPRRASAAAAAFAALALGLIFTAAPAGAQVSELDKSRLIDAMGQEGMSELLMHLIETEPPDDPIQARQVELAQHRLAFTDEDRPRDERIASFEEAVRTMRGLIDEFYDHEQRPIWQTDLAEMLLGQALQTVHQGAPFFYEFGVPTRAQREAVEELTALALESAADAEQRFFQLQTELPREEDHVRRRVNTGQWSRMIDEYYRQRTPYYLGRAAYQVSLLPDEHPYFQGLGEPNPRVPYREDTIDAERERLQTLAIDQLQPFVDNQAGTEAVRVTAMSVTGRALVRRGEQETGLEMLADTIRLAGESIDGLVAWFARVEARKLEGDLRGALDAAVALEDHALVQENPLYRLLLTDMMHRIQLAEASDAPEAQRRAAQAAAYTPYVELFDDASLGRNAEALRQYVSRRWVDTFDAEELDDLPAVVQAGIAEAARLHGQNMVVAARDQNDDELRRRGEADLEIAVEAGRALRTGERADQAPPAQLAQGWYNEALAMYLLDPSGAANLLRVGELLTELADRMPAQPVAERAINSAIIWLRQVHEISNNRPAGADEAYRAAAEVLFREFPTTETADDERVYYAFTVLMAHDAFEEAAEMFAAVPFEHREYFEAQAARARALGQVALALPEDERAAARERATAEATRVREEAEAELASPRDADRREAARLATAEARLVQARMAMDAADADAAIAALEDFDRQFEDEPLLVRDALELRIMALAEAGRLDDAVRVARQMMEDFQDDAAAVINQVLNTIDGQIDAYNEELGELIADGRRQRMQARIAGLAETAVSLADLLYEWARQQDMSDRELLSFELIRAKALRLAGRTAEAREMLAPRLDQPSLRSNASLMTEYAEVLFTDGQDASLREAAEIFDRLIVGMDAPDPLWWNAWMRRLQINDRLKVGTDSIPLRIRQLRRTDQSLGGRRFRETFDALESKHQR